MSNIIMKIEKIKKHFPIYGGIIPKVIGEVLAVDGVSFDIKRGEVMGLVGESGCGKTTLGRTVLRLTEPTSGKVFFEGNNIFQLKKGEMNRVRRSSAIVFQDPFSSLDPRMTIGSIVGEGLHFQVDLNRSEKKEKTSEMLEKVGLSSMYMTRYPHELSGGEKQRVAIARALIVEPKFIVADEPVSSLDVSIQAQLLELLLSLRDEFDLTYLFISHNLSVIRQISDRVAVMYLGKIVELAPVETILDLPLHPYTKALISAVPIPDPTIKREKIFLKGEVPSSINPPSGCRLHPRCDICDDSICPKEEPPLIDSKNGHFVACHLRS